MLPFADDDTVCTMQLQNIQVIPKKYNANLFILLLYLELKFKGQTSKINDQSSKRSLTDSTEFLVDE